MAELIHLSLGTIKDELSRLVHMSVSFDSFGVFNALTFVIDEEFFLLENWAVDEAGQSHSHIINQATSRIDLIVKYQYKTKLNGVSDFIELKKLKEMGINTCQLAAISVQLIGRQNYYAHMLTDEAVSEITKDNLLLLPPPKPRLFSTYTEFLQAKKVYSEAIQPVRDYISKLCSLVHIRTYMSTHDPDYKCVHKFYALNESIARKSLVKALSEP